MVIEDAFELLLNVAEDDLPDGLRKNTFAYYLKQAEKKIYEDYGSWQHLFVELALLVSKSEKEVTSVLDIVEEIIAAESAGESFSSYKLEKYSMIKYGLLKKKDYDGIIKHAFDGEKNDEKYAGLVHEWKEWRLKAYEKMKDRENIESLALEMVVEWNELKIYNMHMANIKEEARRADNRKRYKSVCQSIKGLVIIGGKKEAKLLINEFKEHYKRRLAFMDELSKLKV